MGREAPRERLQRHRSGAVGSGGPGAGLPVYKLLGGAREKVKAYASSFNNLGSPDEYAAHAAECQRQGYRAYKIHPYHYWNPRHGTRPAPAVVR